MSFVPSKFHLGECKLNHLKLCANCRLRVKLVLEGKKAGEAADEANRAIPVKRILVKKGKGYEFTDPDDRNSYWDGE